jgi:hypothetical protein
MTNEELQALLNPQMIAPTRKLVQQLVDMNATDPNGNKALVYNLNGTWSRSTGDEPLLNRGATQVKFAPFIDKKAGMDNVMRAAPDYQTAQKWAELTGGTTFWVPEWEEREALGEGNGSGGMSVQKRGGSYSVLMPFSAARKYDLAPRTAGFDPLLAAALTVMTGGAAAGLMAGGGAAAGGAGAASSGAGTAAGASAAGGAAAGSAGAASAAGGGMLLDTAGMAMTGAGGIGSASSVVGAGAGAAGYGGAAGALGAAGTAAAASGGTSGAGGAASGGGMWDAISSAAGKMSMGDWLNAAGTIGSMYSANKAAGAQADAAHEANALQWKMFEQSRADQMPWLKNGTEAVNALAGRLGLNGGNGDLMRSFTAADFQKDPGYDFRLKEGQKGIDNQFARAGGLLSGAALKAANRFNQDFASNEYGNAYNRFNADQANKYNRLASLANVGQVTANQVGNNALQTGQIVGSSRMDAGNARASGYMGMSNALNNGIGQGYNMYQSNRLMDMWQNRNGYNNWLSNNSSWLADNDMTANELGRSF